MEGRKRMKKIEFVNWQLEYTTWKVWSAGLLVKDALTLTFEDSNTGEVFTATAVINYSARGYGRMTTQTHKWLGDRMLGKHCKYMLYVDVFRDECIIPFLDALKGKEFKSVSNFIREYNEF